MAEHYQDDTYRRYPGFRLLALDSSKLRLPASRDIRDVFGTINTTNGQDNNVIGKQAHGLAAVCDEVLNRIVIDRQLGGARAYEVDLAVRHLPATQANDLLLLDRGYASDLRLATCIQLQRQFVVRGAAGAFQTARQMLAGLGADRQVINLTPSLGQRLTIIALGLPSVLTVRVVRVRLPNGELEVLVTNLLSDTLFPTSSVSRLYHLRWGVETL